MLLPMRAKARSDSEEPAHVMLITESWQVEPRKVQPNTERAEPMRAIPRVESAEAMLTKSRAESAEPRRV